MTLLAVASTLFACRSSSADPEVWVLNEAGDIPVGARDDLNMQDDLTDGSIATTNVDNVTIELPDGTLLDGFSSVGWDIAGRESESPVRTMVLGWPSQIRVDLAETAKEVAEKLDMETAPIDAWTALPRDGGSPITDGQGVNQRMGLSQIILEYRDVGTDKAVATVILYWPS